MYTQISLGEKNTSPHQQNSDGKQLQSRVSYGKIINPTLFTIMINDHTRDLHKIITASVIMLAHKLEPVLQTATNRVSHEQFVGFVFGRKRAYVTYNITLCSNDIKFEIKYNVSE